MAAERPPRADLPTGTVTLLFTDIEGSTQLLRRLGAKYATVQDTHRRLLRDAFVEHDGSEVDTQGDAFMVSFRSAVEAVGAATEAQRALAAEQWPEGVHVRVRMGIHTGEPELGAEGYIGIDVVRAARISAVARGGQVVLSQTTRDIVAEAGIDTADLGEHTLKDIAGRERLHQLVAPGLEREFPPLRALHATNLPSVPTPLVGRLDELAAVDALLADDDIRLVTLTGPGGSGKSRLALEAARFALERYPDGVYLVPLAPLTDPSLVLAEIGRALGLRDPTSTDRLESLAEALRGKRMLLVLDNVEHLMPAAREIGLLLRRAPGPVVIATSRGPLRTGGEHVVAVPELREDDAVTLFVERARAADPDFDATSFDRDVVAAICARVDRLPLAIELAAARMGTLGAEGLLERLDSVLGILTGGRRDAPARQRTLRATIDWSYALLTPSQRALHSMLAVFAGGSALSSVEAVCSGTTEDLVGDLHALVDLGLLLRSRRPSRDPRYAMLATVREYALDVLEGDGRLEAAQTSHLAHVVELAHDAEAGFEGSEPAAWLDRIERDLDNVRAALGFAFSTKRTEEGLRIASSLSRFWRAHGHAGEARRWLAQGLAMADGVPAEIRANALWVAGRQAMAQRATGDAEALVTEAIPYFRETGHDREVVFALSELASIAVERDSELATSLSEEAVALARELDDARALSGALSASAGIANVRGDYDRAVALYGEALELRRGLGNPLLVADSTYHLGEAAFLSGGTARAKSAFEDSLALAQQLGDKMQIAAATCMLGEVALREGEFPRAVLFLKESLGMYAEMADDRTCAECLQALGAVAAAVGEHADAARLWGAADGLRRDDPLLPTEIEIEERYAPVLAAALGEEDLGRLRAEGADSGLHVLESV